MWKLIFRTALIAVCILVVSNHADLNSPERKESRETFSNQSIQIGQERHRLRHKRGGERGKADGGGGSDDDGTFYSDHCELRINEINTDSSDANSLFIELIRVCVPKVLSSRKPKRRFRKPDGFYVLIVRAAPSAVVFFADLSSGTLRNDGTGIELFTIGDASLERVDLAFNHGNVHSVYKNTPEERQLPVGDDSPYAILLFDSHISKRDINTWKLVKQSGQYMERAITEKDLQQWMEIDQVHEHNLEGNFLQDMVVYGRKVHCTTSLFFDPLWKHEARIADKKYLLRDWDLPDRRDLSLNRCTAEVRGFYPGSFKTDIPSPGRNNPCNGDFLYVEDHIDSIAPALNPPVEPVPHCSSDVPSVPKGRYTVIVDEKLADLREAGLSRPNDEIEREPSQISDIAEAIAINNGEIEENAGQPSRVVFGYSDFQESWITEAENYVPENVITDPEVQKWLRIHHPPKQKTWPLSFRCEACLKFFEDKLGNVVKKKAIATPQGYFNHDPYQNSRKIREHMKSDIHIASTNYMFRLTEAKTEQDRQELKQTMEAQYQDRLFATTSMIKTVYTETLAESPFMYHPLWVDLQISNGVNLGTHHYSKNSASLIVQSISQTMQKTLLEHLVKLNKPFTLIVDASTTKRNVPYLITYIQTLEDGYPVTYYYAIIELASGESADKTFASFMKRVNEDDKLVPGFLNYFKDKLAFLSSDSAKVMVGVRNSFYTKLKEITPGKNLGSVGCHAHKIALVVKAAVRDGTDEDLAFIKSFEHNLNSVYSFYSSRGSKRFQHLVDTADEYKINIRRLRKNIEVRWSAAEYEVINSILTDWEAIEKDLPKIIAQTKDFTASAIAQAVILHRNLTDVNYLLLYHEFIDFLGVTSIISKELQQRASILSDHASSLLITMATFVELKATPGKKLSEFIGLCSCLNVCALGKCRLEEVVNCKAGKLSYRGVALNKQDDFKLTDVRPKLYHKLIDALHQYFSVDFLDHVTVFDNRLWDEPQDMATFTNKVQKVCQAFPFDQNLCATVAEELFKLVLILQSHNWYSLDIGSKSKTPPSKFWPLVLQNEDESLDISDTLFDFLELLLVHSDSSSEAERGFSFMSRIGKDSRAGIEETSLDAVLRIKLNGNKPVTKIQAFKYAREFINRDNHVPVDARAGGRKKKECYEDYADRVSRLF